MSLLPLVYAALLAGTLALLPRAAWAQTPAPSAAQFEHFTAENNLRSTWIRGGIVQDEYGFLWVATNGGLYRYDGYEFRPYAFSSQGADDPAELSGVTDSAIDQDGVIWLGTPGSGLFRLDPVRDTLAAYVHDPADPASISDSDVREVMVDSRGMVWAGTAGGGLNRFDPATASFIRIPLGDAGDRAPANARVTTLLEARDGLIWVGTRDYGLYALTQEGVPRRHFAYDPDDAAGLPRGSVASLYEDAAGALWVGTSDGGLARLNRATGAFTHVRHDPLDPMTLSDDNIQIIAPVMGDPAALWIGTNAGGLNKLNTATGAVERFQHDPRVATSLANNDVMSIFTDRAGIVWVGTRNGLDKFAPFGRQFQLYSLHDTGGDGTIAATGDELVQSIYQDAQGIVWLATNTQGLKRFDPATNAVTTFAYTDGGADSPLTNDIEVIAPGAPGRLWLGYAMAGVSEFDTATGTFVNYAPGRQAAFAAVTGPANRSLLYDVDAGVLWLALDGGGLARFVPATQEMTILRHDPDDVHSLVSDRVKLVYQDRTGVIWAGTVEPVLQRVDPVRGVVTRFPLPDADANTRINAIHQDDDGILWLATDEGLRKFDPAAGAYVEDAPVNPLMGGRLRNISVDGQGVYWLGGGELIRYDPATGTSTRFDERDGLLTCCRGWFLNRQTGDLFTSGSLEWAFQRVDVEQLQLRNYVPPLVLTEFDLFGRPAPIGGADSPLARAVYATDSVRLAANDNFAFEFAALDYAAPKSIQYQYRLDGFEDAWNTVGPERRYAAYTSLPPGDYTFRVRATDRQGLWTEQEATLAIAVVPLWWQTRWFQAMLLLSLLGGVFGAYRWRVWQVEQRNRELTELVDARTRELAESEARLRGLVNSTFEAVVIHEQGHIVAVNDAACALFGYARDDLLRMHIDQLTTPATRPRMVAHVASGSEDPYELDGVTSDGRIVPLEVRSKAVPFRGRSARVAAVRDLTERRQMEADQRRLAVLEERERIGRDLHDDLGQIMSYVSLQSQTARSYLDGAQVDRARAVLDQLTLVARDAHDDVRRYILDVRTATPRRLDFAEELTAYVQRLRAQYGLAVHIDWPEGDLAGRLAPDVQTQLLRIIQEALTNVRQHAGVDTARVIFTLHADVVQAIIADEGRGFDLRAGAGDDGETDPSHHFGMAIMRERAEALDGTLEIRAAAGRGTRVVVQLPTVLAPTPDDDVRGLRVLLVDDHPLFLAGLRNMLSARGVEVVGTARDGLEAQEQARHLLPDVILMDVEMPHCNGLDALRAIKQELPDVPVIMLTVAADDATLFEALKSGAAGYLLKNLNDRQFFTLIREAMRGEVVLAPGLAARILAEFTPPDDDIDRTEDVPPAAAPAIAGPALTPRQRDVIELIAAGASNREIADKLYITEHTVKYHVGKILERLQFQSRYELASYAREQGFASGGDDRDP
ncbi:MAG: response regulator [Caldilineaceae bacterium]|nr:response regulator [Caldilineaceae bacterium]